MRDTGTVTCPISYMTHLNNAGKRIEQEECKGRDTANSIRRIGMLDTIIKNGVVVNSDGSSEVDIGIKGGEIVQIGRAEYFSEAINVVDAKGMEVYPGMIDSHVHINFEIGEFATLDTFKQASIAAAYGGTTSIVEFAVPYKNETPIDAVERRIAEAKGNTVIDYAFHACFTENNTNDIHQVKELVQLGIPTIKMFTVYDDTVRINKRAIYQILKELKQHNGLALFHAEDNDLISSNIHNFILNGNVTPLDHAKSRPSITEAIEVASLLKLIEETETPSLFVHMSTSKVRELLNTYRQKNNLSIYTEACTHYLTLDDEVYQGEDGNLFICSPPIRSRTEQGGLWSMINDGLIDIVTSDHSCFNTQQKDKYKDYFPGAPNGLPGIETRGIVLYSEGVQTGRISREQFAAITSENVSKIMGMFPKKGRIAIGSDADITIINPNETYQISAENLHMSTDYTPFEGKIITGKVAHTFVRGHHLINSGELSHEEFHGTFIKRFQPRL